MSRSKPHKSIRQHIQTSKMIRDQYQLPSTKTQRTTITEAGKEINKAGTGKATLIGADNTIITTTPHQSKQRHSTKASTAHQSIKQQAAQKHRRRDKSVTRGRGTVTREEYSNAVDTKQEARLTAVK